VLVIGAGLIGTSIALALRERGTRVWLSDRDPATARLAADLGAGTAVSDLRDAKGIADIAVLAMPPAAVAAGLANAQECGVADVYTDVASVKSLPVRQARETGCDLERYVPGHPLAGRQMRRFGGMVSFRVRGGEAAAVAVCDRARLFLLGESLGGVESLIEHPARMTHASASGSPLEVPADLVRLSVGLEAAEDLVADLARALSAAVPTRGTPAGPGA